MKNKNYYERKIHVKDALRLEDERFVKTNLQKRQRKGERVKQKESWL